jgi:hypothetical protein
MEQHLADSRKQMLLQESRAAKKMAGFGDKAMTSWFGGENSSGDGGGERDGPNTKESAIKAIDDLGT